MDRRVIWKSTVCLTQVIALGMLLVGCSRYVEDKWSRDWPTRFPTSGIVELDGAPLEGATVVFFTVREDKGNKPYTAVGVTDSTGRFSLKTFRPGDGAVAGAHSVMIEKTSGGVKTSPEEATPKVVSHLPSRYARQETSGLTAEVTENGPNDFAFRLESK
jgi:hypothetical protein